MTENLSDAIRARREAIGLSQARLAEVAGVSTGTIRNAEAGKPLEDDTREKIERALGWRPGTVEPMLSTSVMAALAEAYLQFSDPRDKQEWAETRRILHTLLGDLGRGVLSQNTLNRAQDALFQFMPGASAGQLADEMDDIIRGEGSIPVVTTTVQGALPGVGARMEGMVTDPDARVDATVRPASVRARAQVPLVRESAFISSSTVPDDEMHLRAHKWAEKRGVDGIIMTHQMQVPSEILTADGVGYLFAVAPITDDVLAELDRADIEQLAEALRKHGVELARTIVQAKRRARAATQEGRGDEHAEP